MIRRIRADKIDDLEKYEFKLDIKWNQYYRAYEGGQIVIKQNGQIFDAYPENRLYLFSTFNEKKIEDLIKDGLVQTELERK